MVTYGKYLDPKVDLVFKKIFGEHPNLVASLLNALLPLPEGTEIREIEYLSPELVPDRLDKKYSIVDVRCRDQRGRQFIVEMQMYATQTFFNRVFLNTCKAYVSQSKSKEDFNKVQPVYSLNILNDTMSGYENEFRQDWVMSNRQHPENYVDNICMTFIELPNFRPASKGQRKLADLWLMFLTEVDEQTRSVSAELEANADISQALGILERTAFTEAELMAYDKNQDEIKLEASYRNEFLSKGREEGREEGRAEGRDETQKENILRMKAKGMTAEDIADCLGLDVEFVVQVVGD